MADGQRDSGRILIGAAVAAVVLPALVLGLRVPVWIALIAAAAVLAFAFLAPRRTIAAPLASPRPVRAALADAAPALARLDEIADAADSPRIRARAASIARRGRAIADHLRANPGTLSGVHRVFTYYLPRAAALAEAWRLLEADPDGDRTRLDTIETLLMRVDVALDEVADRCADDALAPLDVEMKLMDAALREDMER